MFVLSFLWIAFGILIALIASGARVGPALHTKHDWLWLYVTGACGALAGGWLGFWLLGKYFATPTALWIAVMIVATVPAGSRRLLKRRFIAPRQ